MKVVEEETSPEADYPERIELLREAWRVLTLYHCVTYCWIARLNTTHFLYPALAHLEKTTREKFGDQLDNKGGAASSGDDDLEDSTLNDQFDDDHDENARSKKFKMLTTADKLKIEQFIDVSSNQITSSQPSYYFVYRFMGLVYEAEARGWFPAAAIGRSIAHAEELRHLGAGALEDLYARRIPALFSMFAMVAAFLLRLSVTAYAGSVIGKAGRTTAANLEPDEAFSFFLKMFFNSFIWKNE